MEAAAERLRKEEADRQRRQRVEAEMKAARNKEAERQREELEAQAAAERAHAAAVAERQRKEAALDRQKAQAREAAAAAAAEEDRKRKSKPSSLQAALTATDPTATGGLLQQHLEDQKDGAKEEIKIAKQSRTSRLTKQQEIREKKKQELAASHRRRATLQFQPTETPTTNSFTRDESYEVIQSEDLWDAQKNQSEFETEVEFNDTSSLIDEMDQTGSFENENWQP